MAVLILNICCSIALSPSCLEDVFANQEKRDNAETGSNPADRCERAPSHVRVCGVIHPGNRLAVFRGDGPPSHCSSRLVRESF